MFDETVILRKSILGTKLFQFVME